MRHDYTSLAPRDLLPTRDHGESLTSGSHFPHQTQLAELDMDTVNLTNATHCLDFVAHTLLIGEHIA